MAVKHWSVLVLSLVLAAGCRGPEAKKASGSSAAGGAVSGGADANSGEATVPGGMTPPVLPDPAAGYEIKEGAEIGYATAVSPVAKSLGEKVDDALAELDPAYVNVKLSIDNAGDKTLSTPVLKLQDEDNYMIQFVVPENQTEMRRLVSKDGKSKLMKEGAFVTPDLPKVSRYDKAALTKWLDDFPVRMFDTYTGHDPAGWSKVIKAFQDPKNGFETTIEEREQEVNGEKRPFFRVVARSKEKGAAEFEVVFDSKRYVPVTARSLKTEPDGKVRKMFWSASWKFGGTFAEKDFTYPGSG